MEEYALQVTDEQGRTLEDPRALWHGVWMGGGVCGPGEIGPGESFTKHVYLNQWVLPLSPGRYQVVGVYGGQWPRPDGGSVRSPAVEIEVRPRPEAEMEAYLARLSHELESADPDRRSQAVAYLGFTGSPHALPPIISRLYDEGRNVSFYAQQSFLYMTDKAACIEALLTVLRQRGPHRHLQYLLEIYQVPRNQTLAVTLSWLSDPDPVRRAEAAHVLGRYSEMGQAALDPLLGALKDENPQVRRAAAYALHGYRGPQVTAALIAASKDPDPEVRHWVAESLGVIKDERAVPCLREMIADTSDVAMAAMRALENIGTPAARDALRRGLEVREQDIRLRAATALLGLGDDSVRELLAKALETAQPDPASNLCNALGNAIEKRRIPGPGPEGSPWGVDRDAWIRWLRQKPDLPAGP
jgi:HEAT repeat protein